MADSNVNMKRNILILAGVLGLITSILIYSFLQQAQAKAQETSMLVVVPRQEIPARSIINSNMITTQKLSQAQIPAGSYTNTADVVGKVAIIKLPALSPIKAGDIDTKGVSLGLSFAIPPDMRAVTVGVDQVIGVAGFLKPGDHVDVLATFRGSGDQQSSARTVLQDVQLLAMGSQVEKEEMKKDGEKPSQADKTTATLLVTPQDAEKLVLAENEGKLRLALRAVGDVVRISSEGVSRRTVTGTSPRTSSAVSVQQVPVSRRISEPERTRPWPPFTADYRPLPVPISKKSPEKPAADEKRHEVTVIRGTEVQTINVGETANKGN